MQQRYWVFITRGNEPNVSGGSSLKQLLYVVQLLVFITN